MLGALVIAVFECMGLLGSSCSFVVDFDSLS